MLALKCIKIPLTISGNLNVAEMQANVTCSGEEEKQNYKNWVTF